MNSIYKMFSWDVKGRSDQIVALWQWSNCDFRSCGSISIYQKPLLFLPRWNSCLILITTISVKVPCRTVTSKGILLPHLRGSFQVIAVNQLQMAYIYFSYFQPTFLQIKNNKLFKSSPTPCWVIENISRRYCSLNCADVIYLRSW